MPRARGSARTRFSPPSALAAWARSIARRDTKLGRDVALKILPAAFATDPERLARFQREAHVLASLNHPHIAAIYGLEESDGLTALVLELVDGPTLADRIAQGADPDRRGAADREADRGGAGGRARAGDHSSRPEAREHQGAADGTVKVLDFGLAKAMEPRRGGRIADAVEVADDHDARDD